MNRRDGYEAIAEAEEGVSCSRDHGTHRISRGRLTVFPSSGLPSPSTRRRPSEQLNGNLSESASTIHPHSPTSTYTYTYAYAYGPTGLAGLRANAYTCLSALFASLGGLLFGYDQGVIANVLVMRAFQEKFGLGAWGEGVVSEFEGFTFRHALRKPCTHLCYKADELIFFFLFFFYSGLRKAAMLELGALVGALLAGMLADRYSRRQSIFSACGMYRPFFSLFILPSKNVLHPLSLKWSSPLAPCSSVQHTEREI